MAIGLGIGLFLITLGVAWEYVVAHVDARQAPTSVGPQSR